MKIIHTGKTIKLDNIDDVYSQINIGDHFYNFVRDIVNNEYEVIDIKYLFYSIDDDGSRYDEVEVSYDQYDDVDAFLALTSDFSAMKVIRLIIKNVATSEIFEDDQEKGWSSDFMEWSSKYEDDAFDLADLYFKKF